MRRRKQPIDSKRRKPVQARARNTVDEILEATFQILQREGRDAVNTNRIAERTGVAISTLYQYFRNKEEILTAVARREMERHRQDVVQALSTAQLDGTELDRAVIRTLIDRSSRRHRARRIAMETLLARGSSQEVAGLAQVMGEVLGENVRRISPKLKKTPSPIALFVLTRAVQGVIGAALREESAFYRLPEFEHELLGLVRGYFAHLAERT